jgi:hypothetical protein
MKMRKIVIITLGCALSSIFFCACKKEEAVSKSNGKVVFYTTSNLGHGNIRVTLNNAPNDVPIYTSTPDCTQIAGFYILTEGVYNYSAIAADGKTWSGVINVTPNGCLPVRLF